MQTCRLLLVVFLVLVACACQAPQSQGSRPPTQAQAVKPQEAPRGDDWTRMKECAERVDRMAQRLKWDTIREPNIMGWENHYSPKHGRCFVRVAIFSARGVAGNQSVQWYELYDAFEERLLAACTDDFRKPVGDVLCNVQLPTPQSGCAVCQQYIKERMNQ